METKMTRQRPHQCHDQSSLVTALSVLMLLDLGIGKASAQQAATPEGSPTSEKPAAQRRFDRGERGYRQ